MSDRNDQDCTPPRRILDISPDRIPEFLNQSRADRSLSETIAALHRQFTAETRREMERAEEALRRMGFVTEPRNQ